MKLPIIGGAYELPSQDINNQKCINYMVQSGGPEGSAREALVPTPGLKLLIDTAGVQVRGMTVFDGVVYVVVDDTLFELTINTSAKTATKTSRGTLLDSTGFISMKRNPSQIFIADGVNSYTYTPGTTTFAQINDGDFDGAITVAFIGSYFLYNEPNSAIVSATAQNDGTSVNALDFITAEANPDDVVGVAALRNELWVFGEESIEVFYNAANAVGFPFSKRLGADISQGCSAVGSIVEHADQLFWLDDRGYILTNNGYTPVPIGTEALHADIASYSTTSDAKAFGYNDELGQQFYLITFPTAKKTWAYSLETKTWHERAHYTLGTDTFEHVLFHNHVNVSRLDIVGAENSGKIYVMSHDYRDDAGDPIHRIRVTQHHSAEYELIGIDELEVHMETGKGTVTGLGSDPQIQMRYSTDGGYTWSNSLNRSMGKLGEYSERVRWTRLGTAREFTFEFRVVEPIDFSIISASVKTNGPFQA